MPAPDQTLPDHNVPHGSRFGREHTHLATHLAEDHGIDGADIGAGERHGLHDRLHDRTGAYAYDLPHPSAGKWIEPTE